MMEIEERVLLLGIYKRKEDESLNDTIMILEDAGVFSYKEGKKLLKSLKENGYVTESILTVTGVQKAQEIEKEFTLL